MQIHDMATPSGDATFYNEKFLITLEDHLTYLRKLPTNRIYTVNNQISDKYRGDFFGLLDFLEIPKKYHHIFMLVNGYLTSSDYKQDHVTLLLPDTTEVDLIKAVFDARRNT